MPEFIRPMLVLLLLCFCGSFAIKYVSMNNQQCMVGLTLTDLNPDELRYYPFFISMDRCDKSCNIVVDPFGGIWVSNKIEDLNLRVFNMIKK